MRSPVAGLTVALAAAALAVLGIGTPAFAATDSTATATVSTVTATVSTVTVTPLTPAEGSLVSQNAALTWTEVTGPGYEVRWNADGAVDADGVLDPAAGGRAFPRVPSHVLLDLTAATYHWQVRALPAGEWSSVATFHVDVQLDTLADPPADGIPDPETPSPPAEDPRSAPPPLGGPLHGLVWVAGASSVAGLILAVVGREWLRIRRQEP